jgi:putative salt-induced outer membrane protein YdiY
MVSFLAASALGRADTIHLVSGEKLVGKITSDKKTKVVIRSQTLGRLVIPRDRIQRIELDPPAGTAPVPPTPTPGQPFIPTPPNVVTGVTNAATNTVQTTKTTNAVPLAATTTATNAPSKRKWFWQRKRPVAESTADWIQLKSGEWLRGRLYGMQNRKMDFESDELDDLEFDWKDVHQVVAPRALVSYGERQSASGSLRVDREKVTVTGEETVSFPRFDLVGIAAGAPQELDYWSGRINVGLNLRAGNTEQADLVSKLKLERRTPLTHLKFQYTGNFNEVSGEQTVNNHHATESFDYFLTRRLFLRIPYAEYYHDPFQNIGYRVTMGGGIGYYVIDTPKCEWLVAGGPAYQRVHFNTVEAGEANDRSTPAVVLMSNLDIDLTKRIDLELGYQAIVANENAGGIIQHGSATLEIDLTQRLDLDISLIWDRIGNPQADSSGDVPTRDDVRLNLSLGVKF